MKVRDMRGVKNPYLHDDIALAGAIEALGRAAEIDHKQIAADVRSIPEEGELTGLAMEMGVASGKVDHKYFVELSFRTKRVSQAQLPELQRYAKGRGFVLTLASTMEERVQVSFSAYANKLL